MVTSQKDEAVSSVQNLRGELLLLRGQFDKAGEPVDQLRSEISSLQLRATSLETVKKTLEEENAKERGELVRGGRKLCGVALITFHHRNKNFETLLPMLEKSTRRQGVLSESVTVVFQLDLRRRSPLSATRNIGSSASSRTPISAFRNCKTVNGTSPTNRSNC
jgi:hypothetical protein